MNRSAIRFAFAPSLSLVILMASDVISQERDPFASDPFASGIRSRQVAPDIDITLRAVDQNGAPVADVEIRGAGLLRPLFTDLSGEVTWSTNKENLKRSAARFKGPLRFHANAPKEAVMPHASTSLPIAELLEKKSVQFEMRPGVRLKGRVFGSKDRASIKGVSVEAQLEEDPTGRSRWTSTTDEKGHWNLTIPRAETVVHLVARGIAKGYDLQDSNWKTSKYARVLEIPSDRTSVENLDFEIERIPPLQIKVIDQEARPVAGAQATLYRKDWYDARFVVLSHVESAEVTGPDGACTLFVTEEDGPDLLVAVANVGGENLEGRVDLAREKIREADSIQLVVRPRTQISGMLLSDGTPAQNVPLVLYEAVKDRAGGWTTMGVRGEVVTDERGRYEFAACGGLHYLVATKARDQNEKQAMLHRTNQAVTQKPYEVPVVDLASIR